MLRLNWVKCSGSWCSLETVNLNNIKTQGVYVIWHASTGHNVVRVGQGDIVTRLNEHRNDPKILRHAKKGNLLVTWAAVDAAYRDGVERYLADRYSPLEGVRYPEVPPRAVNLPGQ